MNFAKDDSRKLHRLAVLNCVKQGRCRSNEDELAAKCLNKPFIKCPGKLKYGKCLEHDDIQPKSETSFWVDTVHHPVTTVSFADTIPVPLTTLPTLHYSVSTNIIPTFSVSNAVQPITPLPVGTLITIVQNPSAPLATGAPYPAQIAQFPEVQLVNPGQLAAVPLINVLPNPARIIQHSSVPFMAVPNPAPLVQYPAVSLVFAVPNPAPQTQVPAVSLVSVMPYPFTYVYPVFNPGHSIHYIC